MYIFICLFVYVHTHIFIYLFINTFIFLAIHLYFTFLRNLKTITYEKIRSPETIQLSRLITQEKQKGWRILSF